MSGPEKSNLPLITAVAVCYNHARFVIQCLESIRLQTYPHIQTVIIDNASSDGSQKLIREWITRHSFDCVFIENAESRGISKNFNEALRHAKGKYVAQISADDVWRAEKLERQADLFEKLSEDTGFIYSNAGLMDESGNALPKKFITFNPPQKNVFEALLTRFNWIPAVTALVRRSCFEKTGVYDETLCYEDYDMWLRISQKYGVVYSPEILADYRVVPGSLWHQLKDSDELARANAFIYLKMRPFLPEGSAVSDKIKKKLRDILLQLYKNNSPKHRDLFKKAFGAHLRFDIDCLCLCALAGVPSGPAVFFGRFLRRAFQIPFR